MDIIKLAYYNLIGYKMADIITIIVIISRI